MLQSENKQHRHRKGTISKQLKDEDARRRTTRTTRRGTRELQHQFLKLLGDHLELPRNPQDHRQCPQEAIKSTDNEPKRGSTRSQDHRRIANVSFQNSLNAYIKINVFEGRRGHLGSSTSSSRSSKRREKTFGIIKSTQETVKSDARSSQEGPESRPIELVRVSEAPEGGQL